MSKQWSPFRGKALLTERGTRKLSGMMEKLHLDLGGGYTGVYVYKNTTSCTLHICILHALHYNYFIS